MSGTVATITKLKPKGIATEIVTLTPESAVKLLEHNTLNRPLSDGHVQRIAKGIIEGKWRFNGDTIKIADTGDVLDGQHRLWACIEAKRPIETIIVRGVARDAFATIDTLRKPRTGGDVLALNGLTRYRSVAAAALQWLIRWQAGRIVDWKAPELRVENSHIEAAFADNPGIVPAVARATQLRGLANPSIMAFFYYILVTRNPELAERMMQTLEDPAGVGVNDPFFRLRVYFTADHHKRKEPLTTIALAIKAANAAAAKKQIQQLNWRSQGKIAEAFPTLEV